MRDVTNIEAKRTIGALTAGLVPHGARAGDSEERGGGHVGIGSDHRNARSGLTDDSLDGLRDALDPTQRRVRA